MIPNEEVVIEEGRPVGRIDAEEDDGRGPVLVDVDEAVGLGAWRRRNLIS